LEIEQRGGQFKSVSAGSGEQAWSAQFTLEDLTAGAGERTVGGGLGRGEGGLDVCGFVSGEEGPIQWNSTGG
jgi:hypothetical protein